MSDQSVADLFKSKLEETPTETPETPVEATPVETAPEATPEPQEAKPDRARDESGKFAKKTSAAASGTKANKEETPKSADRAKADAQAVPDATIPPPGVAPASVPPTTETQTAKAPQSWRPAVRELYGKIPAEAQAEIERREKEFATNLQESAQARKHFEEIREVIRPYEADMMASGYSVPKALAEWAQLSHTMHRGSPQQKAALAAHLINSMGGDEVIDAINAARQGQPMGGPQAQRQPAGMNEQQLEAWFQRKAQAAQMQRRQQEITAFRQREFWTDVEPVAMKLLETGLAKDLEEAFSKAKALDPEIASIERQREAANAAQNGNASVQRAKLAASSVKSSPATGVPANGASLDVEDVFRRNLNR
jgi:hypothetical protein